LKKSPLYAETIKQFDRDIKPVFTSSSTRKFHVQLKGANLTDDATGKLRNNTMTFDKYELFCNYIPNAPVFLANTE